MIIEVANRVEIGENDYDGDIDIALFRGQVGTVTQIADGDPLVYYIAFDSSHINKVTGETPDTTWPFYFYELKKIDA